MRRHEQRPAPWTPAGRGYRLRHSNRGRNILVDKDGSSAAALQGGLRPQGSSGHREKNAGWEQAAQHHLPQGGKETMKNCREQIPWSIKEDI